MTTVYGNRPVGCQRLATAKDSAMVPVSTFHSAGAAEASKSVSATF